MSRWLDMSARAESNPSSYADNRQEPAENPSKHTASPFLPVSAGCREKKTDRSKKAEDVPILDLMDRFRERAAILEVDEGQPRERAVWLAALAIFVLPNERAEFFDCDGLKPRCRQISVALSDGIVITFHNNGRVSFHCKPCVQIKCLPSTEEIG